MSKTYYDNETGQEGPAYKALQSRVENGGEPNAEVGLPKSGGGLSGGQKIGGPSAAPEQSPGLGKSNTPLARFCSNCGNAYSTDADKFCGSCGSPR